MVRRFFHRRVTGKIARAYVPSDSFLGMFCSCALAAICPPPLIYLYFLQLDDSNMPLSHPFSLCFPFPPLLSPSVPIISCVSTNPLPQLSPIRLGVPGVTNPALFSWFLAPSLSKHCWGHIIGTQALFLSRISLYESSISWGNISTWRCICTSAYRSQNPISDHLLTS